MRAVDLERRVDREPGSDVSHDEPQPAVSRRIYRKHAARSGGETVEPAGESSGFSAAVNAGLDTLVSRAANSAGHALPDALRGRFETALGTGLGDVRVHANHATAAAADALDARAYTVGSSIYMGAGHYDPSSPDGQFLLAHEVAHTVQQRGAPSGPQCKLQVSQPHDSAEVEADSFAAAVMAGIPAPRIAQRASGFSRSPRAPHTSAVPFSTRPAGPIGIEGTPLQAQLDHLVTIVEGQINAWRRYHGRPRGERPGAPAYAAAQALARGLDSGNYHGFDRRVALYLAHRIGMDRGFLLDEMTRFNPSTGSATCRELFGLTTAGAPIHHEYKLHVMAGHVYRVSAPGGGVLTGSIQVHDMTLEYRNDVGMTWHERLSTTNATIGGGISGSVGGEAPDFSPEREMTSSESEWTPSANFLPPSFFEGGFAVTGASASASAGAGRAQGNAGVSHQIITFGEVGAGQNAMSFELTSGPSSPNVSGSVGPRRPGASAGAMLEVGPGYASRSGEVTGGARAEQHVVAPPERTDDRTLLVTTTIYFDTQLADVDPSGHAEIQRMAAEVRRFNAQHRDAQFEIEVVSYASPRWRGAAGSDEAARNNQQLGDDRARNVVDALRSHLASTDCRVRSQTVLEPCGDDEPAVNNRGSEDALHHGVGEHDDPQDWRRVEINVYRNVYQDAYIQGHRQPG